MRLFEKQVQKKVKMKRNKLILEKDIKVND